MGIRLVFSADDGSSGVELWVTDGTTAGTTLLKDINPGSDESFPFDFAALGDGRLVFSADDGSNGRELWVTDGTTAGTTLLKDINPGPGDSVTGHEGFAALGDGRLVFQANDGSTGTELWVTDGTAVGTTLLKDINPGPGSSNPASFTALDGSLVAGASRGDTMTTVSNPGQECCVGSLT
jgi:ELWxxDGT repeat protein